MFRPSAQTPESQANADFSMLANGLLLLYPFLVHAAIVTDSSWLEFAALVLLGANILGPWLRRASLWAWAALGLIATTSAMFVVLGDARLFLYTAPVLAPLALLWFFGRTLLPGQVPLITRVAMAIRGPLPEPVRIYTWRVTQVWVIAFAMFALTNLLMALLAPPVIWSLYVNFIDYLLVGALFLAEWLFRCWYMRGYESMTWREYMRAMMRLDYRQLLA